MFQTPIKLDVDAGEGSPHTLELLYAPGSGPKGTRPRDVWVLSYWETPWPIGFVVVDVDPRMLTLHRGAKREIRKRDPGVINGFVDFIFVIDGWRRNDLATESLKALDKHYGGIDGEPTNTRAAEALWERFWTWKKSNDLKRSGG